MHAASAETTIQLCRPKTSDHRRSMQWFSSLTRILETGLSASDEDEQQSLRHATQLYGLFAQTDDERYLQLCDDFLRSSLPRR